MNNGSFHPYNDYQDGWTVAQSSAEARSDFIHRTYQHLALAIAAFVGLEALLLNIPGIGDLVRAMTSTTMSWFIVLAVFMGVSHLATNWAQSSIQPAKQYLGLGLYVVAEAIIFVPLMYMAQNFGGPGVIAKAGIITGVTFSGLTAVVLISKKDFSFLRGFLAVGGFAALGLIGASMLFGFSLGSWFALAMVIFAGGAMVYQTSNILHVYRPGQHVAAALGLFAAVALMLWYVVSLLMARD